MSLITRRRFASLVGFGMATGVVRHGWAQHAETPSPAKKTEAKPVVPAAAKSVDRSAASPEEIWADLMEGNKRFVSGKTASRDVIGARAKTATGQHPYVTVLCCSDSRLSPELIFDQNIGDLFVVRTAGNIADPIALGSTRSRE